SPEAALDLLGDSASGEGLAGGGDGDAASWQAGLEAAGGAFSLFDTVTGRIADGSLELNGVLRPGYGTGDVQSWLEARLGDGWTASLRSEETAANEGDRRISLATGEAENYRQGFWLPDVDFPVSPGRCKAEIDAALASEQIQFVVGSARIDSKGRALLNRLAAVSVRCLNSEVMRLQIIGHTDSVGNDDRNLRLSQDRADAVLGALAERGVRQDAMESLGMGEADPVASNNTADGRSQNRRIEFVWIENNG
ncbi:MAG: OmpA family protein, partial [Pseudomonadota bacterium]